MASGELDKKYSEWTKTAEMALFGLPYFRQSYLSFFLRLSSEFYQKTILAFVGLQDLEHYKELLSLTD